MLESSSYVQTFWHRNTFWRLDVTDDKVHSLDMSTRSLIWKLDKPLHVKVYFTEGLQAPYNNHRAALVDKLEELRATLKDG